MEVCWVGIKQAVVVLSDFLLCREEDQWSLLIFGAVKVSFLGSQMKVLHVGVGEKSHQVWLKQSPL